MLSLIVAVAENCVIGRQGDLPWRLSADLRRFKRLTMGSPLIMGRRTWQSIGRPLPGRSLIVVTRQAAFLTGFDNVRVAATFEQALQIARSLVDPDDPTHEVFVIGGAALYAAALPLADRIHLTRVHANVEGDVFFPKLDEREWRLVTAEPRGADAQNEYALTFETYDRR